MVSEGVWRVSGDASIPNVLAKNILDHDTLILLSFFQCPVLHKIAYALGCLNCVWECLDGV